MLNSAEEYLLFDMICSKIVYRAHEARDNLSTEDELSATCRFRL